MRHSAIGHDDPEKRCACGGSLAYQHEDARADLYRCLRCNARYHHRDEVSDRRYSWTLEPVLPNSNIKRKTFHLINYLSQNMDTGVSTWLNSLRFPCNALYAYML